MNFITNFPAGCTPSSQQFFLIEKIEAAFKAGKKFVICCAPTGAGKAQPLYSKIKTPTGWTTIGEAKVGDIVTTPTGKTAKIIQIHDRGVREIYKVTMADGRTVECCDQHLWKIHSHNFSQKWKIVDTIELKRQCELGSAKPHIQLIQPADNTEETPLPLNPYLLGCLLSGGRFTGKGITFTTADEPIKVWVSNLLPPGYELRQDKRNKIAFRIVQRNKSLQRPFYNVLDELHLQGKSSSEKFIPEVYLSASLSQRIQLLQGLLDTDGTVGKRGGISIGQTSKQLALDIIQLVRSIGGQAKLTREYFPTCLYKSERRQGQKAYTVSIRYHTPSTLFALFKKKQRCATYQYSDLKLKVVSVTATGQYTPMKCITIDSVEQLYITDEYTVTHNSHVAKTFANSSKPATPAFASLINTYEAFIQDYQGDYEHEIACLAEGSHGAIALTVTKALQDQYLSLFDDAALLKGKSNYLCDVDPSFEVDTAPCLYIPKMKTDCWEANRCPYYTARNHALVSQFTVLNYKMFQALPSHVKQRDYIICDEASELEEELVRHFSAEVTYSKLKHADVKYKPLITDDLGVARGWITDLQDEAYSKVKSLTEKAKEGKKGYLSVADKNRLTYCRSLYNSLKHVSESWTDSEYIVDRTGEGVTFTPLKVDKLSKSIFDHGKHVLLMSATIVDHKNFAKTLGITDYEYVEVPSTFDPNKSPIHVSTRYKLNYSNLRGLIPQICKDVKILCEKHGHEKGVIHTHSQEICDEIYRALGNDARYLFRKGRERNEHILKQHTESLEPTVLVSPSLTHGVDLKDDLARFQVIIKLPYAPLSNKRIKRLFDCDKTWYLDRMLSTLIQTTGRTTRSVDDHSVTYILDGNIVDILDRSSDKLPKHFLDRFQ